MVHMAASPTTVPTGIDWAAEQLPDQYANPQRLAGIFGRLGKPAAARFLKTKLPSSKQTRSGELGEIIGAQYAVNEMSYRMVERLRWKDHDDMPMRGDDLVGLRVNPLGELELLKGEAKSRVNLSRTVVAQADQALQNDDGLPAAHALSFIADRLQDLGEVELADLADEAQLGTGIKRENVVQLLFTFTGNDPRKLLRDNTEAYEKDVKRFAVGLQIPEHQKFIADVYSRVIANA